MGIRVAVGQDFEMVVEDLELRKSILAGKRRSAQLCLWSLEKGREALEA